MSNDYSASSISVLKGLDAIKARPGMYVGDISSVSATHHLLFEIFDNSIDEALAGHARRIEVCLFEDGSAGVSDDGRGIPVDTHPEAGISAAEVIFTTLHAGGKFDNDSYHFAGGLHGVGAACTNALSVWMDVEIRRDGAIWAARFENGETVRPITRSGRMRKHDGTGTHVRFLPSPDYLAETGFVRETLLARFREVALLNPGVEIVFTDHRLRDGEASAFTETCRFDDGMADFVRRIRGDADAIVPIAKFQGSHGDSEVDAAFTWVDADRSEDIQAYTNNIPQPDGGQHVAGLRGAVSRALTAHAEKNGLLKRGSRMGADDLREGLAAALHVRLADPAFSSQTKEKLISTKARSAVEAVVGPGFARWLDTHPEDARAIIARAQNAAEAREAARKAREITRTKKAGKRVSSASLPENLSDCSGHNAQLREIFLVEGDSAGGSAKQGRDRETQAILPLKGKILNVERARQSQILKNNEIAGMVQSLGAGLGAKMDLDKLRYGKIVIMTDADVDGAHIATLILTFFFRQMRPLIEAGHLHLAVPPLYRVRRKGEEDIFVRSDRDLAVLLLDRVLARGGLTSDGETLRGDGARKAMMPLIREEAQTGPAERILGHPALADALLGLEAAEPVFGTGPTRSAAITRIRKGLEASLALTDPDAGWTFDIFGDGTGYGLAARRHEDGIDTDYRLGAADLAAWQVQRVREAFVATGLAGTQIMLGNTPVQGPIGLSAGIRAAGFKGAAVSRYKGLGEMNPDELWETTMNPKSRTLKRVSVEHSAAADAIFSDLMADNVSARRKLIEDMCAGEHMIDI